MPLLNTVLSNMVYKDTHCMLYTAWLKLVIFILHLGKLVDCGQIVRLPYLVYLCFHFTNHTRQNWHVVPHPLPHLCVSCPPTAGHQSSPGCWKDPH